MTDKISIEREFYIPETIFHEKEYRSQYNMERRSWEPSETIKDDDYIGYVNQKGARYGAEVYYCASSQEHKNVPITGLTIDKSVYGEANYRSFIEAVTVVDPRGFTFTISVSNFLYLARHNVIDNGEIMAECILSWSVGGYLTLITTDSESYKSAVEYTAKQHMVFDPENLEVGSIYNIKKSSDEFVYLGKHKFNTEGDTRSQLDFNIKPSKQKRPVFYNLSTEQFVTFMLGKNLSGPSGSPDHADVDSLIKTFKNTREGRTVTGITLTPFTEADITYDNNEYCGSAYLMNGDGNLIHAHYSTHTGWDKNRPNKLFISNYIYGMEDGMFTGESDYLYSGDVYKHGAVRNCDSTEFMDMVKRYNLMTLKVHFEDELSDDLSM